MGLNLSQVELGVHGIAVCGSLAEIINYQYITLFESLCIFTSDLKKKCNRTFLFPDGSMVKTSISAT